MPEKYFSRFFFGGGEEGGKGQLPTLPRLLTPMIIATMMTVVVYDVNCDYNMCYSKFQIFDL